MRRDLAVRRPTTRRGPAIRGGWTPPPLVGGEWHPARGGSAPRGARLLDYQSLSLGGAIIETITIHYLEFILPPLHIAIPPPYLKSMREPWHARGLIPSLHAPPRTLPTLAPPFQEPLCPSRIPPRAPREASPPPLPHTLLCTALTPQGCTARAARCHQQRSPGRVGSQSVWCHFESSRSSTPRHSHACSCRRAWRGSAGFHRAGRWRP